MVLIAEFYCITVTLHYKETKNELFQWKQLLGNNNNNNNNNNDDDDEKIKLVLFS